MQRQIPQSNRAGSFGRCGVIAEFVPNPTLSGIEEHRARIAEGPEAVLERFCWPNVVAIEGDMFPAERRDMSNKYESASYVTGQVMDVNGGLI